MSDIYEKKKMLIEKSIESSQLFSSYQMQVIKSKYYTAKTFDPNSDEYKKRIDEISKYIKETLNRFIAKQRRKIGIQAKRNKFHEYIITKDKNLSDRSKALENNSPIPELYELNDEEYYEINNVYRLKDAEMLMSAKYGEKYAKYLISYYLRTGDSHYFDIDYDIDRIEFITTMVSHALAEYISQEEMTEKYPKFFESRKGIFDYINIVLKNDIKPEAFLLNLLNNQALLAQFINSVNPVYFDKLNEDHILLEKGIKKQQTTNPELINKLSKLEKRLNDINLDNILMTSKKEAR